jgi:hypothetical protein
VSTWPSSPENDSRFTATIRRLIADYRPSGRDAGHGQIGRAPLGHQHISALAIKLGDADAMITAAWSVDSTATWNMWPS